MQQLLASDPEVLLGGGQETLALPDAAGTQQVRACRFPRANACAFVLLHDASPTA